MNAPRQGGGCGSAVRRQTHSLVVATAGSDSDPQFFPVHDGVDLDGVGQIATTMEYVDGTSNLQVRPALRLSEDGLTWSTPVGLGGYQSTPSTTTYTDFMSVRIDRGDRVQVGLQAINAGRTTDIARGIVRLELSFRKP